ncbi:MAG: TraB/GumN family protein [Firmicutes bacterium]|nr:TraB/GumN family protein [Bacillota bacterium]
MSDNIHRLNLDGKEIILIGTAHVSKHSEVEVKEVIEAERPDSVCVELDKGRYNSVVQGSKWKDMDIIKIIKEKKAPLLLVNLVMSSFQKRIAKQFGINPGAEMVQGINSSKEVDAKLVLADRNIQTTFSRIWRNVGFIGKGKLLLQLIFSIFNNEEISEEELEELKSKDMLTSALNELSDSFPELKTTLIDERDKYLSHKIKNAPGEKVVAVLGAGHVPGILKEIHNKQDMKSLNYIPPKSKITKMLKWAIPLIILFVIASTFYVNRSSGMDQTLSWVLWNGALSSVGAILALGHPFTIATAFLVAPLSSLNPAVAAGWFAGLVETFMRKPNVADFESLSDDVFSVKGFWRNKVTRILLVVVLTNIGSSIGTAIGGADVIRLFVKTFWG